MEANHERESSEGESETGRINCAPKASYGLEEGPVRPEVKGSAPPIARKTVNGQRLWVVNGTEFIDDDENEDLGAHQPAEGADGCTSKVAICTPETQIFP